jgi:hypothetical protein
MDSVTEMFNRGMAEMRDLFVRFQKGLTTNPTVPHSVLEKFVIPPFPINWALGQLGVLTAIDLTAHLRYVTWHIARFGDSKRERSDSSYAPSESENDSDDDSDKPKLELVRSKQTKASKRPPSHHVFQSIKMNFSASGPQPVAGASTSGLQPVAGASTSGLQPVAGASTSGLQPVAGASTSGSQPVAGANHKQGSTSRKSSKSSKSASKSKGNRHGKGPNKRAKT